MRYRKIFLTFYCLPVLWFTERSCTVDCLELTAGLQSFKVQRLFIFFSFSSQVGNTTWQALSASGQCCRAKWTRPAADASTSSRGPKMCPRTGSVCTCSPRQWTGWWAPLANPIGPPFIRATRRPTCGSSRSPSRTKAPTSATSPMYRGNALPSPSRASKL